MDFEADKPLNMEKFAGIKAEPVKEAQGKLTDVIMIFDHLIAKWDPERWSFELTSSKLALIDKFEVFQAKLQE